MCSLEVEGKRLWKFVKYGGAPRVSPPPAACHLMKTGAAGCRDRNGRGTYRTRDPASLHV